MQLHSTRTGAELARPNVAHESSTNDLMKTIPALLTLGICSCASYAQNQSILSEDTVKVSDHVWAIMGFPNIGIVVGRDATLVVDTGLGPRNGATAAKVAKSFAPHNKLYLTTTHFHPEHAGGASGFPPGTILIRDKVQQEEMEKHGAEMIQMFSSRNAQWKELLADAKLPPPDETFDKERVLDLGGGVKARLLWFGGAHTKGDELTFVEPDQTLISGDVVQNKVVPNIFGDGGTPTSWIAVLDQVAKQAQFTYCPTIAPSATALWSLKKKHSSPTCAPGHSSSSSRASMPTKPANA